MLVLEYPGFVVYAEQSPRFGERALSAFGNWGYRRCFHGSVVLLGGCDVRSAPGDDTLVLPIGLRFANGFRLAESVVASLIGRGDRLLVVRNPWREARSEWIDNDDQAPEVHATRQSLFCTSPGTSAWNLHWLNDAQPCSPTCLFAFDRSNRSLEQELLQTLGARADAGSYISSEFWARVCIDRNFASRVLDGCKLWAFLDGCDGSDVLIYRPQPDTECVRNAVVRFSGKLGFVTYDGGSIEDLRAI